MKIVVLRAGGRGHAGGIIPSEPELRGRIGVNWIQYLVPNWGHAW